MSKSISNQLNNIETASFMIRLAVSAASIKESRAELILVPRPPESTIQTLVPIVAFLKKLLKDDNVGCLQNQSDEEIKEHYGEEAYNFLCCILKDNILKFQAFTYKISLDNGVSSLCKYKVTHSISAENNFRKKSTTKSYLYHGSHISNWYSILKNGLKNYSEDKTMRINGAAYGAGIYLSNSVQLSASYSVSTGVSRRKQASPNTDFMIIAVVELAGNSEDYKKSSTIFVVEDDSLIMIRELILIPIDTGTQVINTLAVSLNEHYANDIHVEVNKKINRASVVSQRRLLSELTKMKKERDKLTADTIPYVPALIEDNLFKWKVRLINFPQDLPITTQMKKYNIKEVELEIRFSMDYPHDPPFIRVVSPRFKWLTGHITKGGSICKEVLTRSGWNSIYKVDSILIDIRQTIGESNASIVSNGSAYTFEEAEEAFKRVANDHGWTT
jgi:ubiquitin-protein ligase